MTRKRIEFSFSVSQATLLGGGWIITLLLSFAFGILVGREMDGFPILGREARSQVVKMRIEPLPQTQTPISVSEKQGKSEVMNNVTSKPLITFYDTLSKTAATGKGTPVVEASNETRKDTKSDNSRRKLYTVQVGAMKDRSIADAMASNLKKLGYSAYIVSSESSGKGILHKVRIGTFPSREDAHKEALKIKKNEKLPATVMEK